MIFLYTLILLALGLVRWLIVRRAAALARKYSKLATMTLKFVAQPLYKPGNSNQADSFAMAKRQYELGRLVTQRDRVEAKHFRWETWAERLTKAVSAVRTWKGKKLPYTLGVLDVWLVLYAIDYFGVAERFSARHVIDMVVALVHR